MFDAGKTKMIVLPYGKKNYNNMLSRFHLIPERHGQMDRQQCWNYKNANGGAGVRERSERKNFFPAPPEGARKS